MAHRLRTQHLLLLLLVMVSRSKHLLQQQLRLLVKVWVLLTPSC
jgi:hypothetical protein